MSKDCNFEHVSVLYKESLELLSIKPDGIYVDCTLGGGGHSSGILNLLSEKGKLIAFDKDKQARKAAAERLSTVKGKGTWEIIPEDFSEIKNVLHSLNINAVDGIIADLGVSSWQLDQPERGFSYGQDGPLDMRMNMSAQLTAEFIVNNETVENIAKILKEYGEERYAMRIARAIDKKRNEEKITRTVQLAEIVKRAMPGSALKEQQHPARRTFQALRIAVNNELGSLESLLKDASGLLNDGGRLCIISFHSLEDRLVKEAFKKWENPCTCPRSFPVCICGKESLGRQINRKGLIAGAKEAGNNPRARSARLRCFERIVKGEAPK